MKTPDELRRLLCALQDGIRDALIEARRGASIDEMSQVAEVTSADTIYQIDKVSEEYIRRWFESSWPADEPVEVVMEGLADGELLTVPAGTPVTSTRWKAILDPIDGTRGLMYDKRSAWSLAALAPQRGDETSLADIEIAAMTELPTSKQWRADQISAVRGCGPQGVIADAVNILDGARRKIELRPSRAETFRDGFAALARFFPEGKAATAQLEEDLWQTLGETSGAIFDDQYISTGGQLYEIAAGHDRMLGDLRPLIHQRLGLEGPLCCHPYDICTALILTELGGIVETPQGTPLDAPLDTTTSVAWMAYANPVLAEEVRLALRSLLAGSGERP